MLQQTTDPDVSLAPEEADARPNLATPLAPVTVRAYRMVPENTKGYPDRECFDPGESYEHFHSKAASTGQACLRVILLEDHPADGELVLRALRQNGFVISHDVVQTPGEFLRCIRSRAYDVVLADYNLPQWRGMEALALRREEGLDIPVIIVTGSLGDVPAERRLSFTGLRHPSSVCVLSRKLPTGNSP